MAEQIIQDPVLAATNESADLHGLTNYLKALSKEARKILNVHTIDIKNFSFSLNSYKKPKDDFQEQVISTASKLKNKTLLLPSWDQLVGKLL